MPSHKEPPPPYFQYSPAQVFAAASIALFSKGFEGSPGTGWKRQSSVPLLTSRAARYPRNGTNSAPATPMKILPLATRGAIVIEYGESTPSLRSGVTQTDQRSFPVVGSSAW